MFKVLIHFVWPAALVLFAALVVSTASWTGPNPVVGRPLVNAETVYTHEQMQGTGVAWFGKWVTGGPATVAEFGRLVVTWRIPNFVNVVLYDA